LDIQTHVRISDIQNNKVANSVDENSVMTDMKINSTDQFMPGRARLKRGPVASSLGVVHNNISVQK